MPSFSIALINCASNVKFSRTWSILATTDSSLQQSTLRHRIRASVYAEEKLTWNVDDLSSSISPNLKLWFHTESGQILIIAEIYDTTLYPVWGLVGSFQENDIKAENDIIANQCRSRQLCPFEYKIDFMQGTNCHNCPERQHRIFAHDNVFWPKDKSQPQ